MLIGLHAGGLTMVGCSQFHFVHAAVNIVEEAAILLFGLLPWAWDVSFNRSSSHVLHLPCW